MSSRTDTTTSQGWTPTVLAGVITAVVGFTSSFAVVLTGLRTVGADATEAASGLLVVTVTMGVGCALFSWLTRQPVTMAWSTPGAALLAGAATPEGGWPTAVGAFALAGVLYGLTALIAPLGRWVAAIPSSLANAMLAGVLLQLCLAPFVALPDEPAAIAPVIAVWALGQRFFRQWAVPAAFATALVVIVVSGSLTDVEHGHLSPVLTWTTPQLDVPTLVAIGLPLYLVTMTSQNIPGTAVLKSFGYVAPVRPVLAYTGAVGVATAPLGAFSINLGALSAAISAGPSAHPDPARRWVAGVSAGTTYLLMAPFAAAVAAVAVAAPTGLVAAVAGLALLGAFGNATASALADTDHRESAALTFVVAASGLTVAGVGSAFWALLAGGAYLLLVTRRAG
ncbi:benzoate/H(+) symporter BenE family transporter [Nocardioides sp. SYSU D00038]|uniref:benzoate/H(+) symporter BenE family transporter n=1 Tax=Nocardioides sp. SYSU D00038 TaxID=2812554 RepID=UPI0019684DFC|nr:benzoate/H(+) symporter BenE family transporter [Nocardioides sp. SYSU D00038]